MGKPPSSLPPARLYPGARLLPDPRLRETDFGPFENKNHQELAGTPLYEAWTRSVGRIPVPGLESREEVAARALPPFRSVLEQLWERWLLELADWRRTGHATVLREIVPVKEDGG